VYIRTHNLLNTTSISDSPKDNRSLSGNLYKLSAEYGLEVFQNFDISACKVNSGKAFSRRTVTANKAEYVGVRIQYSEQDLENF
jgi:hypothetical protein